VSHTVVGNDGPLRLCVLNLERDLITTVSRGDFGD
jgi:hypothetical protein